MERNISIAVSVLFVTPIYFFLNQLSGQISRIDLYMLWGLVYGGFVTGILVWSCRCGLSENKSNARSIRILDIFFFFISTAMCLFAGLILLGMNSLLDTAIFLSAVIVAWEGVSKIARRMH